MTQTPPAQFLENSNRVDALSGLGELQPYDLGHASNSLRSCPPFDCQCRYYLDFSVRKSGKESVYATLNVSTSLQGNIPAIQRKPKCQYKSFPMASSACPLLDMNNCTLSTSRNNSLTTKSTIIVKAGQNTDAQRLSPRGSA